MLQDVGFVNVKAEDRTDQFVKMLEKELKHIENIKEDFVKVSHDLVLKDQFVIASLLIIIIIIIINNNIDDDDDDDDDEDNFYRAVARPRTMERALCYVLWHIVMYTSSSGVQFN